MSFYFQCPHCNTTLEAEEDWIGMTSTCPVCNKGVVITQRETEKTNSPCIDKTMEIPTTPPKSRRWVLYAFFAIVGILIITLGMMIIRNNASRPNIKHKTPTQAIKHEVPLNSCISQTMQHINSISSQSNKGGKEGQIQVSMSKEKRHSLSANVPMFPEVEEFPFALGDSLAKCTHVWPELSYFMTQDGYVFYQDRRSGFIFKNNELVCVEIPGVKKASALNFGAKVENKWGEPDINDWTKLFGILRWDFKNMIIVIKPSNNSQENEYNIIIHNGK